MPRRAPDTLLPFKLAYRLAIKPTIRVIRSAPPETEYFTGAMMMGTYLAAILAPELLPDQIQQILLATREISLTSPLPRFYETGFITGSVFGLGLTVEGAGRIVRERLPYARAFVHEFLLNRQ